MSENRFEDLTNTQSSERRLWARSFWVSGLAFVSYVALAIALTWPLAPSARVAIPLGSEETATVPHFNLWTVWWNADRLAGGLTGYWNAPIFYPATGTFAFSEAQPTTWLVAPLVGVGELNLGYNVYLLALLTLNGWVTFGLLRRVGLSVVMAGCGGVLVEALPIVQWQLGVLQLVAICGPVWVLDRLVAFGNRVSYVNAGWLGCAFAVCYAACNYYGLFLSVVLPVACWPIVWGRLNERGFWLGGTQAVVVAALVISPIVYAQWDAKETYEWERDVETINGLSAHASDYLQAHSSRISALSLESDVRRREWLLGTGTIVLVLGGLGAALGLIRGDYRRFTLFLIVFTGASFGASLGPGLHVPDDWSVGFLRGWSPYRSLMAIHPGLGLARSPFRFAFFVQLGLSLLAVIGLQVLADGVRWLKGRCSNVVRVSAWLGGMCIAGLFFLMVFETWPKPQRLTTPPERDAAWVTWLRQQEDRHLPIVCLPFAYGAHVREYERTTDYMLWQAGHRRPMMGGYSGFFPAEYLTLREEMQYFPTPEALDVLRRYSVAFVVTTDLESTSRAAGSSELERVFDDREAGVAVWRVWGAGDLRASVE